MKHYEFKCINDEDGTETIVRLNSEHDAWSGFGGPMYSFFNFLKGCGYVFHHNTKIGVMDEDDEFTSADDPFSNSIISVSFDEDESCGRPVCQRENY